MKQANFAEDSSLFLCPKFSNLSTFSSIILMQNKLKHFIRKKLFAFLLQIALIILSIKKINISKYHVIGNPYPQGTSLSRASSKDNILLHATKIRRQIVVQNL